MKSLFIASACLVGLSLAGCASIESTVQNIVAAAPQTCADLQAASGNISTFASEVAAANTGNATVQSIITKINNGLPLVNSDCRALAALAPSVSTGVALGTTIGSQIKP